MKKIIPLLCLALVGCEGPNNIKGELALNRATLVKTTGGNMANLSPARYSTTVQMDGSNATLFIQTNQGSISFVAPGIPANGEGRINIPASQLGQEFGLRGEIATRSTPFDRVIKAICVYERRPECRPLPNGGCQWEEREIPGKQKIREQGVAQVKAVKIDLVARNSKSSGQFNGSYSLGETIQRREAIGWCERW